MNDQQELLNYRVSDKQLNRRPVVFLHGFLESLTMWDYLDTSWCSSICIDLPGHGKSALGKEELTMCSMAEEVIRVLRNKGVKEYDIVGHSMGGYVALEVKKQDAGCKKLVLLNSNFWTDSKEKQRDRKRVAELVQIKKDMFINEAIPNLFMQPDHHEKEVEELIGEASLMTSEAVARASIAMSVRNDNLEVLRDNPQDIFILQGKYDTIVSKDMMIDKLGKLPVLCIEIPSGHMAHIEHTELVNESLKLFLLK